MKKITAFVTALVLLFSITVPAFATTTVVDHSNEAFQTSLDLDKITAISIVVLETQTSEDSTSDYFCTVNENSYVADTVSLDKIIVAPVTHVPASRISNNTLLDIPDGYQQISFSGCPSGSITTSPLDDDATYNVSITGNSITLNIYACQWRPAGNRLNIGFLGLDNGIFYVPDLQYEGGLISDTITFRNMPAGRYAVAVKNEGSATITEGLLAYLVTF